MNIDKFYSENSIDVWKKILGLKLHYHLGSKSEGDIFDQAIKNLFPYIDTGSTILDCGCGWGGPSRILMNDLKCQVTGLTISKQQAMSINDFPVNCCDLDYYNVSNCYDTAIFVESFCHLKNPKNILTQLHSRVEKIIIKDYLWNWEWYNKQWGMYMRPKSSYIDMLKTYSYEIDLIETDTTTDVISSCEYWYNNFDKIDKKLIFGQLKNLYELCCSVLSNKHMTAIHTVLVVARPV